MAGITQIILCIMAIISLMGLFLSWNVLDSSGDVRGVYALMIAFSAGFVGSTIAVFFID